MREKMFIDKKDIEQVLITAIKLVGIKKGNPTFPDIFNIAHQVMQNEHFQSYLEIKESHHKETYFLSRSDLEKILIKGELKIEEKNCKTVSFVLKEDSVKTMTLENGKVLMWYEGDKL